MKHKKDCDIKFDCEGESCACEVRYDIAETYECEHCCGCDKTKKNYIALFGYPMDNSVRAGFFDSLENVAKYHEQYKDICYLIVAFEYEGKIYLGKGVKWKLNKTT